MILIQFLPEWAPNIHPMIVHFPIGLLVFAVILDLLQWIPRLSDKLGLTVLILYAAGSLGSIAAFWTGRLASETDVEEQRRSYHDLSETMIAMVEVFGHQKGQLYHQRCPMVNGGNGDWLSTQERIMNPYHGERMLHCGSTVRTL